MPKFDSKIFRSDLISVVEHIRDLCSAKVPHTLGHYTGSQLRMITRIYELTRNSNDGLQLKTLAKVLHITPAATSEMVETLVKRGALERRIAPNDRRAMSLRLSRELENVFLAAEAHLGTLLDDFFSQISAEDSVITGNIIGRLNKFLADLNQAEAE
jgi:DNA-binding MarR family transcriptional regulator